MLQNQDICQTAWERLLAGDKCYYTNLGFFALGDAFLISGKNPAYKDEIVLVEHRWRTQYNHWGWRIKRLECRAQPTIAMNGDDGFGILKRKAPSLKTYE